MTASQRTAARRWIGVAAVLTAAGVVLGAFGAHGLQDHVTTERLETWTTASRYHLLHTVALLVIAGIGPSILAAPRTVRVVRWLMVAGLFLFSGSLYLLVLLDAPTLGGITPFGGAAWIAAWILLAVAAFRLRDEAPTE